MSPLGEMISEWLKTKPGEFKADTPEELMDKVHAYAKERGVFRRYEPTVFEFTTGLRIAGYTPKLKQKFGTQGRPEYWSLALPEF